MKDLPSVIESAEEYVRRVVKQTFGQSIGEAEIKMVAGRVARTIPDHTREPER